MTSASDYDTSEIDASRAPLVEHLRELRGRLIKSLLAFLFFFLISFYFAKEIYGFLVLPFGHAAGPDARLIYTAPQEYFFTQLRVAFFVAAFLSCPVILAQIYGFVSPGLYLKERRVFIPYLVATPVFFILGGLVVYFFVMPNLLAFLIGQQQANLPGAPHIELMPRVSEYLSFIMMLIFAFGLVFQLPVILTLLAHMGIVSADFLARHRRHAIVLVFLIATVLTPPDVFSQLALAFPGIFLYEISIMIARMIERKREG